MSRVLSSSRVSGQTRSCFSMDILWKRAPLQGCRIPRSGMSQNLSQLMFGWILMANPSLLCRCVASSQFRRYRSAGVYEGIEDIAATEAVGNFIADWVVAGLPREGLEVVLLSDVKPSLEHWEFNVAVRVNGASMSIGNVPPWATASLTRPVGASLGSCLYMVPRTITESSTVLPVASGRLIRFKTLSGYPTLSAHPGRDFSRSWSHLKSTNRGRILRNDPSDCNRLWHLYTATSCHCVFPEICWERNGAVDYPGSPEHGDHQRWGHNSMNLSILRLLGDSANERRFRTSNPVL